nr:MAG TPA: hypothetical protein [Caudoviricetes sp.]DAY27669.1 MAG TPA: hypothetical protein [Caudoviricetes sp.]
MSKLLSESFKPYLIRRGLSRRPLFSAGRITRPL